MSDLEILRGYFFSSRYLSKDVYGKYGLDPVLYDVYSRKRISQLKQRLKEIVEDQEFVPPETGAQFRDILGDGFSWVRSSLDVSSDI